MPQYAQIETYAKCDKFTLPLVINSCSSLFDRIGYHEKGFERWLVQVQDTSLDKNSFDNAFIFLSPSLLKVGNLGEIVCEGVQISLNAFNSTKSNDFWMIIELLFDAEKIRDLKTSTYPSNIGKMMWLLLREFAITFRDIGTFFTDEAQENQTWNYLIRKEGDLWSFDLALIPKILSTHFRALPTNFSKIDVDNDIGIAQTNRWVTLPWETSS